MNPSIETRSAAVALVGMTVGPHPGRHVLPGDLLSEDEARGASRVAVARLPLDRGVLRLARVQTQRVLELERRLAEVGV